MYREDLGSQLKNFNADEALAFGGLIRALLIADGQVCDLEHEALARIAEELGEDVFWQHLDNAAAELDGVEGLEGVVRKVTRPAVRELIFGTLYDLAMAASILPSEAAILDRLTELWGVSATPVATADKEPGDDA